MNDSQQVIEKIRGFNRYYTNVIGLLNRHYLDSPFSLIEGRVLYEIKHIENCSAKKIKENIYTLSLVSNSSLNLYRDSIEREEDLRSLKWSVEILKEMADIENLLVLFF